MRGSLNPDTFTGLKFESKTSILPPAKSAAYSRSPDSVRPVYTAPGVAATTVAGGPGGGARAAIAPPGAPQMTRAAPAPRGKPDEPLKTVPVGGPPWTCTVNGVGLIGPL